ncbi:MAG: ankyrin repeat domain-containing protein [Elusimicrobiota bacterium]
MTRRILPLLMLLPLTGCVARPLVRAVKKGDIHGVRTLVESGADVNEEGGWFSSSLNDVIGQTALEHAARHGELEIAKLLIRHGADVNHGSGEWTPLFLAVESGQPEMVRLLLENGANIYRRVVERAKALDYPAISRLLDPDFSASRPSAPAPAPAAETARPPAVPAHAARAIRSDVDRPGYRSRERPDDFALVIGIEDYSDLPDAKFAGRDAEAVVAHMRALGIPRRNIIHLTGTKAISSSLKKYLESWLPRNVKPTSRVFVYFSGHGAPELKTGEAYLVPWDGDPNFLSDTAYPVKRLYGDLAKLKAKQVVVALDACFSGAGGRSVLAEGMRPLVMKVNLAKGPGGKIALFTAAASNEVTSTLKDKGHGMFTYFFLKGLNGEAKDGQGRVTAKSLYDYLKPRVQDEARRQNREQTPALHAASDVVLRAD